MNLTEYAELLSRLENALMTVDAGKCVTVRNRNVQCGRCAQSCAGGCLSVQANELTVNPERCIGCGTCATVCPAGAIEPRNPDDHLIAHEAVAALKAAQGKVVFACADALSRAQGLTDPDTVIGVACVGRIEESLITLMALAGATEVRLVCADCVQCPHAKGAEAAQEVCHTATELLKTWGSAMHVLITDKFPRQCMASEKAAYDAERREFFLAARDGVKNAAYDAAGYSIERFFEKDKPHPSLRHVKADGTLPHEVPRRRALLLDCLKALGSPTDELIETRLWGHVVIDAEKCVECRMCAVFCPTGALSKYLVDGADKGLLHAPGICVKCRTCEQVCMRHALSLSDEVFAIDLNAGVVEGNVMGDVSQSKGGPDAIRNSMSALIDSPYLWG